MVLRIIAASLVGLIGGSAIGWNYNNNTRVTEFYVYNGNPSTTKPVSGFKCKCINPGDGSRNWKGSSSARCASKDGVFPLPIFNDGRPMTSGACCQGTASPSPNKKSPVINNIPVFTGQGGNIDPCHV